MHRLGSHSDFFYKIVKLLYKIVKNFTHTIFSINSKAVNLNTVFFTENFISFRSHKNGAAVIKLLHRFYTLIYRTVRLS